VVLVLVVLLLEMGEEEQACTIREAGVRGES
jgi:hypothetical protein